MRDLFYDILNAGLWGDECLSKGFSVSEREADVLFEMGLLQAVSGLMVTGMDVCGVISDKKNKNKWIGTLLNIEDMNRRIEALAGNIVTDLKSQGITAEVFKGTSVAKWYKNVSFQNWRID